MNQQQAQTVIGQAQQIDSFDFETVIKRVYPDRTDLENIVITQLSLQEFLHLSKRVFGQFISELQDRDNYIILPFTFTNVQLGQANVDGQIQGYFANLNGDNFAAAENILFWLISYQVENGFYNKSSKRQSEHTTNNVSKLSEKLGLLEINIEKKLKEVQTLNAELETNKKEIQTLISQKETS
jgi:DNA-binding protein Fis